MKRSNENIVTSAVAATTPPHSSKRVKLSPPPRDDQDNSFPIDMLPVELLGRHIFSLLPWDDRMRLELVCKKWRQLALAYAWSDVKYLDENNLRWKIRKGNAEGKKESLLNRVAPHLTTLSLWYLDTPARRWDVDLEAADATAATALRGDIEKCGPKLKHLQLWDKDLGAIIADNNQRLSMLKSLSLRHYSRYSDNSFAIDRTGYLADCARAAEAFPNVVRHCSSSLECLEVQSSYASGTGWLRLPFATSLTALSFLLLDLILRYNDENSFVSLSEENAEALVSLPALSSLIFSVPHIVNLRLLGRLSRLTYLAVSVDTNNVQDLIEAFPQLGCCLKALEFLRVSDREPSSPSDPIEKRIASALSTNLPRLEHFGILKAIATNQKRTINMLAPLAQLKRLRSLEFPSYQHTDDDENWRWLERMPQLEFLKIWKPPSLDVICGLIRECKKMSLLKFHDYKPGVEERKALIQAATITNTDDPVTPPVMLYVPLGRSEEGENLHNDTGASRLRFLCENYLTPSHVLHHHKYGCLSDGRPPFERNSIRDL